MNLSHPSTYVVIIHHESASLESLYQQTMHEIHRQHYQQPSALKDLPLSENEVLGISINDAFGNWVASLSSSRDKAGKSLC